METYDTVSFHLAGIVPISGQDLDFNMPWHDCLMPINQDFTLLDLAVYECACAGVKSSPETSIQCSVRLSNQILYRFFAISSPYMDFSITVQHLYTTSIPKSGWKTLNAWQSNTQ